LNESDRDLIEAASAKISDFYEENRHHVGAALKTKSGKIVAAVHIESYIGRVTYVQKPFDWENDIGRRKGI
jgi:cytidine deaminase